MLAFGVSSIAAAATEVDAAAIAAAKTPAAHQALADQYSALAAEATEHAKHHEAMGAQYRSDKTKGMAEHCEKLAQSYKDQATQYEALAKGEAAQAK
jgi:hypothetical protein